MKNSKKSMKKTANSSVKNTNAKNISKRITKKVTTKNVAAPKKKSTKVQAIPKEYTSVTAHLVCKGAGEAMDFYAKAFGAKDKGRLASGNVVVHGEMRIGDAMIMIGEEMPEMGAHSPLAIGGSPVTLMMYVKDVDAAFARATAAGCTTKMPPTNMFWGDRYCRVADPFGHQWAIATHIENLSMKEMGKRMAAEFGQ